MTNQIDETKQPDFWKKQQIDLEDTDRSTEGRDRMRADAS